MGRIVRPLRSGGGGFALPRLMLARGGQSGIRERRIGAPQPTIASRAL